MLRKLAGSQMQPPSPKGKTIVQAGLVLPDATQEPTANGAIVFEGNNILAAGEYQQLSQQYPDAETWDASEYIAIPGLINAHTHVGLTYLRGLGHGQADMISNLFFATEAKLDSELLRPLSYSYIVDGLRSGVTVFGDHYYFIDAVGRALEDLGVRGALAETINDIEGPLPGYRFDYARKLIENWPFSDRITPVVGPHATNTLSKKYLKEMADYAKTNKLPLHMHLAQTAKERAFVESAEGMSPVALAEKTGALGEHALAVHLIATDKEDWKRLHDSGTTIGLCPGSQIIFEKLAPLKGLIGDYDRWVLGNDCAASNDGADLLAESRLLGLLAKHEGVSLTPNQIFAGLTTQAARLYNVPLGRLEAGYKADIVFIKRDITLEPNADLVTNLIYSAANRNVEHVMIDGSWVLFNREPTRQSEADLNAQFVEAVRTIHQRVSGPLQNYNPRS